MRLLTNSSLKAYRRCCRLFKLRYVDGWRCVVEDEVLRFGSLVHLGLEAWFRAQEDRLAAALLAMAGEADPFERARAEVLIEGYDARWSGEEMEVLAVEAEFRAPLINPETGAPSRTWDLAGKIDAVVKVPDSRVLVVEHKTSSENVDAGSDYWRRLRMDGQVSTYLNGARALGFDVAGCLYDVVSKPALRPLKATPPDARKFTKTGALYANQRDADETPDAYRARLLEALAVDPARYYSRGEVVRLDADLAEHAADVWQVGQTIRDGIRLKVFPRNPDGCIAWGRTCEYFDVCSGAASLDDPARFKRVEQVHSELSATAPTEEQPT